VEGDVERRFLLFLTFSLVRCLYPDAAVAAQLFVELCDTTELDPSILLAAREEASDLFAKANATLQWQSVCDQAPPNASLSARIYLLPRFQQGLVSWHQERGKEKVMGYFGFLGDVRDGVPGLPAETRAAVIYVARNAVESTASLSGRIRLTETRLARAMGRVMAHELAHRWLGPTHTRTGILKDFLDHQDLILEKQDRLFFTSEQVRSLNRITQERSPQRP
jgi:hypothetical protein